MFSAGSFPDGYVIKIQVMWQHSTRGMPGYSFLNDEKKKSLAYVTLSLALFIFKLQAQYIKKFMRFSCRTCRAFN